MASLKEIYRQQRASLGGGGELLPLTDAEIADFCFSLTCDHFVNKAWTYYVTLGRTRGLLPNDWEL